MPPPIVAPELVASSATGVRWNVSALQQLAREDRVATALARCRAFERRYSGRIETLDAKTLRLALDELGELWAELGAPAGYVELRRSLNRRAADADACVSSLETAVDGALAALASFEDEWAKLPNHRADRLLRHHALAPYRYVLSVWRASVRTAEDDGSDTEGAVALYERALSSVCCRLAAREMPLAHVLARLRSSSAAARAAALASIASGLEPHLQGIADCLDTIVRGRVGREGMCGFERARAIASFEVGLEPALAEALVTEVERHREFAHHWFLRKARLLRLRLNAGDEHAPLGPIPRVPFERARIAVTTALQRVDPELSKIAAGFFDENRIDAEPRPEKSSMAFCLNLGSSVKPHVLLRYEDRLLDAFRLAHELGHGIHFELAAAAQPPLVQEPSLAAGEAAALFVQQLVADELASQERNLSTRRAAAAAAAELMIDALFRQAALARFELELHRVRARGQRLTPAFLGELWLDTYKRYLGSAVDVPPEFSCMWACSTQLFYIPFSSVGYVAAQTAALLLLQRMRDDASFGDEFVAFLRRGGADGPVEELAALGIDLADGLAVTRAVSELSQHLDPLDAESINGRGKA